MITKNNIVAIFWLCSLLNYTILSAQVGIGTTQPEAALDVTSPVYGFLPPRVSLTSLGTASPIKNPKTDDFALATGTMVYHDGTNGIAPGYYYWNGSSW